MSTNSRRSRLDQSAASRRLIVQFASSWRSSSKFALDSTRPVDRRQQFARKKHSTRSMSDISQKIVENMNVVVETPPVRRLNNLRKLAGRVVNHGKVQGFLLALIVINAILMGVATFPSVKDNPAISSKFELIDYMFLLIFTTEAALQVLYHGWTLFKDSFLVFDLTIVALSWAAEGVKVVRAFRIFRALRLITRIETMRNLVKAVIGVTPNLTGIAMLLLLVFYIFAVMFTQLYKDSSKQYPREQQYFVALPDTVFTLFQMMTLDGWKKVFLQAYEEYDWSWILFVTFIVVTAFVFANLIIAVICDAVHALDDKDAAALIGCEEEVVARERGAAALKRCCSSSPRSSRFHHLREIELQLNDLVAGHEAVRKTLKFFFEVSDTQNLEKSGLFQEKNISNRADTNCPAKDSNQLCSASTDSYKETTCTEDIRHIENLTETNQATNCNGLDGSSNMLQIENSANGVEESSFQLGRVERILSPRSLSNISDSFVENMTIIAETPLVRRLDNFRKFTGKVINNGRVQGFILALIVINAIMMGVATFPVVKENPIVNSRFDLIDQIFLVIFTIEASMQLTYHGWTLFKDPFLVFDLTIVALSWALEGVKVARAFRIFRALRLIARIDTMKNLIAAVTSVLPRLAGIMMLLFLEFYIFAVMFTQLYKDVSKQYPRTEQYFVGLPETFFTLFQIMTLDGWRKIFLQAYDAYFWSWMPFVVFVVISAFIVVNLVIAVICDAVHVLGDTEAMGLTGCDEESIVQSQSKDSLYDKQRIARAQSRDSLPNCSKVPGSTGSSTGTLDKKLRDLEDDLILMVTMQNELVSAVNTVARSRY